MVHSVQHETDRLQVRRLLKFRFGERQDSILSLERCVLATFSGLRLAFSAKKHSHDVLTSYFLVVSTNKILSRLGIC